MKKIAILFTILLLTSCTNSNKEAELGYNITGITEKNDTYEIALSVSRPDLSLKQPQFNMSLTDLQENLRLKNLSLNDTPCFINEIPGICEFSDYNEKQILKAEFIDTRLESELLLPSFDFSLEKPEIDAPKEDDDKTVLIFKEVNADSYDVEIKACYDADSCQISLYSVKKDVDITNVYPQNELTYFAEISHPGNFIKLIFKFDPSLFKTVTYSVTANKKWPSLLGISLESEKSSEITF
jgi:hypothetical protein